MQESSAKLSIITPFRDAGPWIRESVQSVLSQSFQDWEWILVDDHSTDNSRSLVATFAEKDARIKVLTNQGKGILPALQYALAKACGSYITRMDADDIMPTDRLGKMVEALENVPPKIVVTGLVRYFSEGEVSGGYRKYERWLNDVALNGRFSQNIYRECVVASPNWMMRRNELEAIGGFDGLTYPEDYDLVFRWYANNFHFEVIPEVTLLWREHPDRTSRKSKHYNQHSFFELKIRRFAELDLYSENLCLWGTGRKGKFAAKVLERLGIPFHWMAIKPQVPEIYGHQILDFRETEQFSQAHVLVAVYPPTKEREKLKHYLHELGLAEGKGCWFL